MPSLSLCALLLPGLARGALCMQQALYSTMLTIKCRDRSLHGAAVSPSWASAQCVSHCSCSDRSGLPLEQGILYFQARSFRPVATSKLATRNGQTSYIAEP